MPYYEAAQICMNGHVITSILSVKRLFNQKYCTQCGALIITTCPKCNERIQGSYYDTSWFLDYDGTYRKPAFCHNCGAAYPWTDSKLKAARDLSDDLENLTRDERDLLKKTLDDIVRDTPETTVSAQRFKNLAAKAGSIAANALKDILVDIVSETDKKVIWPTLP